MPIIIHTFKIISNFYKSRKFYEAVKHNSNEYSKNYRSITDSVKELIEKVIADYDIKSAHINKSLRRRLVRRDGTLNIETLEISFNGRFEKEN